MSNGDNTNVELAVRWTEAGQNVPAKTIAGLQGIKGAAAEAAPAIGDRMSNAFARLEAREPTMVLRRARFAVEELTASAIGSTGPMGRLAASFVMLGGVEATAAITVVAALGIEVKTLIGYADNLDRSLLKLNERFATLGGPSAAGLAGAAALRLQEPEQPGWALRLMARLGTLGTMSLSPMAHLRPEESGEGDLNAAIQEGFGAQQATFATAAALTARRADAARRSEHLRAGQNLLGQINAKDTPERIRDLLGRRDQFTQLGAEGGQMWAKALLGAIEQEAQTTPDKALRLLLGQRDTMQRLGGEAALDWSKAWLDTVRAAGVGVTARNPLRPGASAGVLGAGAELPRLRTFDFAGPAEAFLAAHAPLSALGFNPDPTLRLHGLTNQPIGSDRPGEATDKNAERNAERIAAVIGREIGPLIAMVAGIGRGSGGQAAVAGLGAVAGTLGDLRNVKGMAMLGHAAPWLSLAGGVLSGMSSLFGGQKPKVIITAFEEEAARQIKELRGEPATTQFIVLGPVDMRKVQQQLALLNRMGVITRLPR